MSNPPDLQSASQHCRLLSDSTRLRLLMLLDREELSVAELSQITQLAQPRVSTHLAKLKEAQLVVDRRDGVSVYYRMAGSIQDTSLNSLWNVLKVHTTDPLIEQDLERIPQVLAAREGVDNWADSVAGDMDRHYSPGRTWEATARGMVNLLNMGRVLDIASGDGVLAELLAPHCEHVTCLDLSERVVAAGQKRVERWSNVDFELGDMHELPIDDQSVDTVLLMHALTYTQSPRTVFAEIFRVLKPGGRLLAVTLQEHKHEKAVQPYGHTNLGFKETKLEALCKDSGLDIESCSVAATEKRAPHFAIIILSASRPTE